MTAVILDYKYYPYIAIIPGYILGDIVGAISAFLLVKVYFSTKKNQLTYELVLLKLSSLLIKTDGEIDGNEVSYVQQFFKQNFGNRKSKLLFKQLKDLDVSSNITALVSILKTKLSPVKYYSIIQFLFALASIDGTITSGEDDFICVVAEELGFDKHRVNQIRNQFVKTKAKSNKFSKKIIEHLGVLGLKEGASESDIKSAYRMLAKEYHPDKLSGMSEGIKNLAKEKFQMIQDSYEYLNKNYH